MKKFLTFLIVLVVVFTFGLVVYRLVRNEESITVDKTSTYYNVGEEISFSYKIKNKNRTSKVNVASSDENVVKQMEDGKFVAVGGGYCQIIITHTNPKGLDTTFAKDVAVGDGNSIETPWYIRNEAEFLAIFTADEKGTVEQKLEKHYCQIADITLSNAFVPSNATLKGSYRGLLLDDTSSVTNTSYSKIIGYKVETTNNLETSSLFKTIAQTGKFGYINFEKVSINGSFDNASVVCAENFGTIDFVSVTGTINNTNTTSKTSAIATSNKYYEKGPQAAIITRCSNFASLTTASNQIAGIVCENSANVTFCTNGGESATDGKLSASGTNLIAGGIVGKNYYGFGDDLKNAITSADGERIATELAYRPQVKDCYSTAVIVATPNLSGNSYVGGIIGLEVNGTDKDDADYYDQTFDNLTLGNYYLKDRDDLIFDKGVGNLEFTKVTETNIYSPSTEFVAVGIEIDQLMQGILTIKDDQGTEARASLVSFYDQNRSTSRVTWLDESMYYFYTLNGWPKLPILNKTTSYFGIVNYRLPSTNVALNEISSLQQFLHTNFTTSSATGGAKEYLLKGWIDFNDSKNAEDFTNYYKNKGTEENPAKFVIRADQAVGSDGQPMFDEAGNPIYYGFKNLSSLTANNAKFAGLFGVIKDSTFEDVSFVDCYFTASDNSVSVGVLAGYADNSSFNNIRFFSENEGVNGVEGGANTEYIGAIAGQLANNSSVNGVVGTVAISGNVSETATVYVGGIAGASADSGIRNVNAEVAIQVALANAGGVAGRMTGGTASRIKLNSNLSAKDAAGFAHTMSGAQVDTVVLKSVLDGNDNSAGVAVVANEQATFNNASIDSEFKNGAYQAGLFITLGSTASAQNVVHTNNFNNSFGVFYAKTRNVAAQRHTGDGLSDGQINKEGGAGTLNNCFVLNKVLGVRNYSSSTTTFYAAQCSWIDDLASYVQTSSYDPTAKTVYATWWGPFGQFVTVFGNYGAGILDENGSLYNSDTSRYSISLANGFGFGSEWNFNGFPTLNF